MNPAPPPTTSDPRPWYVRHRLRSLMLTFGAFLLLGAISAGTAFVLTVNRTKQAEPYRAALERVQQAVELQREIGAPIEAGWLATGSTQVAGPADAPFERGEYAFRVRGPEGKAGVRAVLERPVIDGADGPEGAGAWTIVFLDVGTHDRAGGTVVTLVDTKPPVVGADLPEPTPEAKERYGIENLPLPPEPGNAATP